MSKEIFIVWKNRNEKSKGIITEDDDVVIVYLEEKSFLERMEKDIDAYKNRITVLQNLNKKYREKLGISNEPVDAINAVNDCNHENIQMKSSGDLEM